VSGGDPGKAFLTAALTSVAAGAFGFDGNGSAQGLGWADSVRGQDIGQILFGSAVGGVTSKLQNGNFFEGAAIGLTVSLLNHVAHQMADDGDIDPPGKKNLSPAQKAQIKARQEASKLNTKRVEFVEDFAGGVGDFVDTYGEMRDANLIDSDKYFHSKANFKASLRGPGGEYAAEKMSNLREFLDQRWPKYDSRASSMADQKANLYGRSQGVLYRNHNGNFNYSEAIPVYRKNYFPSKY
jgi:serum amyloid A protein